MLIENTTSNLKIENFLKFLELLYNRISEPEIHFFSFPSSLSPHLFLLDSLTSFPWHLSALLFFSYLRPSPTAKSSCNDATTPSLTLATFKTLFLIKELFRTAQKPNCCHSSFSSQIVENHCPRLPLPPCKTTIGLITVLATCKHLNFNQFAFDQPTQDSLLVSLSFSFNS